MTRHTLTWMALTAAAALVLPGMALADEPAMMKDGMLVDHKSMTLYTYDKDQPGKSTCNSPCTDNWPPLMAMSTDKPTGKWTIIKRDDGMMQWAYEGKPVYTFAKDTAAGEMKGDKMKDVWHVIKGM
jgi:predicted lipoprotein with Yx(FWY)xxD motif